MDHLVVVVEVALAASHIRRRLAVATHGDTHGDTLREDRIIHVLM